MAARASAVKAERALAQNNFGKGRYRLVGFETGVDDLVFDVLSQILAHVDHLLFYKLLEELLQARKNLVLHVVVPGLDPDAVVGGRCLEILRQVVNNDCALQLPTQKPQVFSVTPNIAVELVFCRSLTWRSLQSEWCVAGRDGA